jgi:outer membrane protein assembly factor BamB
MAELPPLRLEQRIAIDAGRALLYDTDGGSPKLGLYDPVENQAVWQRELSEGAVPAVGAGHMLGVVDKAGKLSLLDLPTGEEISSSSAESLPNLNAAAILQFDDTTVFAIDETGQNKKNTWRMNPNAGEMYVNGKLIAVNTRSGQVLWSQTLLSQKLQVSQPSGLPLLVAFHSYQTRTTTRRYGPPVLLLDCIDIRSGEVVKSVRRDGFLTYGGYRIEFDANTKTAVIDAMSDSLEFRFVAR